MRDDRLCNPDFSSGLLSHNLLQNLTWPTAGHTGDLDNGSGAFTTTGLTTTGELLITTPSTNPYRFQQGTTTDHLGITGIITGRPSRMGLYSFDGTGVNSFFEIFGLGTVSEAANTESLLVGWADTPDEYWIATQASGTGTIKNLALFTEGNTGQFTLVTDGTSVFAAGDVIVRSGANDLTLMARASASTLNSTEELSINTDIGAVIIDPASGTTVIGDFLDVSDSLKVNISNIANQGLILEGSAGSPAARRGGHIQFLRSESLSAGWLFANSNFHLVGSAADQGSGTDEGNWWIDFVNGDASFAKGTMTISAAGAIAGTALDIGDGTNKTLISTTGNITQEGTGRTHESEKFKLTAIGGYAIRLTNQTGSNSVAGDVVEVDSGNADSVVLATANSVLPVGVFLDSGIADGSEAWVVVSGIADVHMDAGGCAVGDRIITSATPGRGDVSNTPAIAVHFQEIGHAVEAAAANANARCVIHFL